MTIRKNTSIDSKSVKILRWNFGRWVDIDNVSLHLLLSQIHIEYLANSYEMLPSTWSATTGRALNLLGFTRVSLGMPWLCTFGSHFWHRSHVGLMAMLMTSRSRQSFTLVSWPPDATKGPAELILRANSAFSVWPVNVRSGMESFLSSFCAIRVVNSTICQMTG